MNKSKSDSLLPGWVTEIIINSPKQDVWNKLVDFANYNEWNPFVLEATADFRVGGKIRFLEDLQEFGKHWLTATFLDIQEPDRFLWQGNYMADFVFRVRHGFKLESISNEQTRFIHSHENGGLLIYYLNYRGVFSRSREGYFRYNEALKKLCESTF